MQSERLRYAALSPELVAPFRCAIQDDYVRRYLLDGQLLSAEGCAERIRGSQTFFERLGVGTWLASHGESGAIVGFCGFEPVPESELPYLIYAVFEPFARQGYASEMARHSLRYARTHARVRSVGADVDEVNQGSVRILEKLGFRRTAVQQGAFGNLYVYRLEL
jgi:[ribosomal protein S5]-alanine N-acetyltransferase